MPRLDVSNCTRAQKYEILKFAVEVRKFEIERFWGRSTFFWGFAAAAFVAYGTLYDKNEAALSLLVVACFGFICSLAWTLSNRGGKYWQEAWEQKVESVENELGAPLFSNREPLQLKCPWGAARYSVSKLTIALSDFTVLVWLALIARDWLPQVWFLKIMIGVTAVYALAVLFLARTSRQQ